MQEGIFKTSMIGGFDKQSVLTYVDELIEKAKERENELEGRCRALKADRDSALSRLEELEKKNEELEAKAAEAAQSGASLEEERTRRQARMAELEAQLASYSEQSAKCQAAIRAGEEKSRQYDKIAAKVGVVMVEAQKQADDIIGRARDQADQIAQEAIDNIYTINKHVDAFKGELYRLRAVTSEAVEAMDQHMGQIEMSVKEAEGRLYINAGTACVPEEYGDAIPRELSGSESYIQRAENPDFFGQPYQG